MRLAEIHKHLVREQGPMQNEQRPVCHLDLVLLCQKRRRREEEEGRSEVVKAGSAKERDGR